MRIAFYASCALCMAMTLAAGTARASNPIAEILCESTDRMHQKLIRQFGEQLQGWGTRSPDEVMQIWTDDRGDWTLVVTYATGTSCIVAMGKNWEGVQADNPA